MDVPLPSPTGVNALRESFGDRKLPDITRKITACVACRKQKVCLVLFLLVPEAVADLYQVKCHMRDGESPCSRCKKRGLPCTVNRSLQTILEEDAT